MGPQAAPNPGLLRRPSTPPSSRAPQDGEGERREPLSLVDPTRTARAALRGRLARAPGSSSAAPALPSVSSRAARAAAAHHASVRRGLALGLGEDAGAARVLGVVDEPVEI